MKSYLEGLEIEKYPRIYFEKKNIPTFKFIFEEMTDEERLGYTVDQLLECIISPITQDKRNRKYQTIRFIDKAEMRLHDLPIFRLINPTYGSKIKFYKEAFNFKNVNITDLFYCPNPELREK